MYVIFLYVVCILTLLAVGAVSIFENYRSPANRSFFFFTLTVVGWMVALFLGHSFEGDPTLPTFFLRLANGLPLLMGASLVSFFYHFPRKTFNFSKNWRRVFLAITLLSFVVTSFTPLVQVSVTIEEGQIASEVLGPLFTYFTLFFLAYIVLAATFAVKKLLKLHGIEKKKVQITAVALLVFILLTTLVNAILPIFDIVIFVKESILFSLLFTVPAFYSLHKHRFFHLSQLSLNAIRLLFLGLIFFVTLAATNYLMFVISPSSHELTSLVISAVAGLAVYKSMEKVFPHLITKDFRVMKRAVAELHSKLAFCEQYARLKFLLEECFVVLLGIKNVRVFAVRSSSTEINIPVYLRDSFCQALAESGQEIFLKEEINYLPLDESVKKLVIAKMDELEGEIIMPLYSEKTLIGLFTLAKKKGGYSQEEVSEILSLKKAIEVSLMNILLTKNLQEENSLLRKIIGEKTSKLQAQFEEIKKLLNLQSDFLAVTAHEFRTPLSIAMFQLEDTIESHKLSPEVLEEMQVLESSLVNLRSLTGKLFDVQQYDLNKVSLETSVVDLRNVLEEISRDFSPLFRSAGLEFVFEDLTSGEVKIELDDSQIRQVIHNLLTNAQKFVRPEDGSIVLRLEDGADFVKVTVADNGEGIADENKERVFEKFQSEKATMGMGIGLGLYICKKIIELHDGSIWVEDTPGGGATFSFKLGK